ncbi:BON domain-containing protein [Vibrio fluvialis]|uniref:BON domain-containing protein n=1 Tax=Vibrio fluvialis TaxID=676 RepID=UPI00050950CA|nr:BON domain-containing protein [Vibrio fluvialis]AVH31265.1 BON domain-containing protein [Vibrio fluvialis]EKO3487377.1 BON domain-containing protein [Vibrio fluvialis]EKO3960898.1 BON domain-containing protein [Vibrio fluvialis]MBL4295486.1 BON domain-containing protein [Vibrio fluvialis]MBY8315642.1 BON domain-containing protein [Vibrio fluvialis]
MKTLRLFAVLVTLMTLSGCAGLFIAGAATTVNIATDPRTTQEIWKDSNLELEVTGLSNKPPFQNQMRITASSFRGTVILIGQSRTPELLDQFVAQVQKLKDVKELHNQVKIKAPLSFGEISNDSWITTKVKSALLAKSELNGVKVSVITEDREVYLLGYISREHANIATDVARNISGVKQVIRAFEYAD